MGDSQNCDAELKKPDQKITVWSYLHKILERQIHS